MNEPEKVGRKGPEHEALTLSTALGQFVEQIGQFITQPRVEGWNFWQRFGCAFPGALTFFAAFHAFELLDHIKALAFDKELRAAVESSILWGIGGASVWFAWLVALKDNGYGPVRLYLAGFLLPTLVWSIIDTVLIGASMKALIVPPY